MKFLRFLEYGLNQVPEFNAQIYPSSYDKNLGQKGEVAVQKQKRKKERDS